MAELHKQIEELKGLAVDDFSRWALEGAQRALADLGNPLRLNFFSTAMRILFEHMMDTLSPIDEVVRSSWFRPELDNGKPTKGQRITFAIQGGLSEEFVHNRLKIDPRPLRKRLLAAVDELSKQVHGRENTIIRDPGSQEAAAAQTTAAMEDFLVQVHDCRAAILGPIAEALDSAAVDALLSETILEVDELATHHSLDEVYVEEIIVHKIGCQTITYEVLGSVEVTLQWGSNSDLRNDIGCRSRPVLSLSMHDRCAFGRSLGPRPRRNRICCRHIGMAKNDGARLG